MEKLLQRGPPNFTLISAFCEMSLKFFQSSVVNIPRFASCFEKTHGGAWFQKHEHEIQLSGFILCPFDQNGVKADLKIIIRNVKGRQFNYRKLLSKLSLLDC